MIKLPVNCVAEYHPGILSPDEADTLFTELNDHCNLTGQTMKMADGSEHPLENGTYLFADEELTSYDKFPEAWGGRQTWTPLMKELKDRVTAITGQPYHVCRIVHYINGENGMDFHSDPPAYGDTTWIASISLGEEREFQLRSIENPDEIHSIALEHGSLIVMGPNCQARYEHAIPKNPAYKNSRINLTFRRYGFGA